MLHGDLGAIMRSEACAFLPFIVAFAHAIGCAIWIRREIDHDASD